MVATLLRLKLQILANGFRRSPWQIVGLVLGGLYGLGVLTFMVIGLVLLRLADVDLARTILVLAGFAAVLGWTVVPILASGMDMTLDPQRFAAFGIPQRELMTGMALAGLVGIPGLLTAILSLTTVVSWWRSPLQVIAALVGALLGVASCLLYSRCAAAWGNNLSQSRRYREIGTILIFIPLVLLGPIISGAAQGLKDNARYLPDLAAALAWTPFGAPWALPADVAAGEFGAAALRILICLAMMALAVWLWNIALVRSMVNPPRASGAKRAAGKLGFFSWFPATPTGAVAARTATYWFRDPRYSASLIVVPLMPVLLYFMGMQNGNFSTLLVVGPLVAFLMSWSISSDVSYDDTAFALHISTGTPGRADRWGRVLGCCILAVPAVLVVVFASIALSGRWELLPGILGASAGVLMAGLGLASVISARYVTAVPKPGESPFKNPPGGKGLTLAVQGLGMLVLLVICLPLAGLLIAELVTGNHVWGWVNLLAGSAWGAFLLWLGVRLGGRDVERRGPELLAQLIKNS
ncbi:transporter [Arthrobacter woluwensis]|uniref:ABC-2 type transport system permease protein n=1 Tax=Arthrobacter woluwensis TaxID=156980 RepID=A0A1H4N863_9MICC|nr:transporter [Arthrobacter woluwensis]SEB91526.1 ABC-2 type transport system permease protein [Arthrobacter woluwensis]